MTNHERRITNGESRMTASMKGYVANTDYDWYTFLRDHSAFVVPRS